MLCTREKHFSGFVVVNLFLGIVGSPPPTPPTATLTLFDAFIAKTKHLFIEKPKICTTFAPEYEASKNLPHIGNLFKNSEF
nr:MAG TPA: hypothetical protein [Crassvirales sp.]